MAFGKRPASASTQDWQKAVEDAFDKAFKDTEAENPHARARAAGMMVKQFAMDGIQNEDGVHVDSVLGILGSMAGYACLSQAYTAMGGRFSGMELMLIETADGKRFYAGNMINRPLLETKMSVWSLVAGMAQHLGASALPDMIEIVRHVTRSYGTAQFGLPRFPDGHNTTDLPIEYVRHFWPPASKVVQQYRPKPEEVPIIYGFAIQETIKQAKDVLDLDPGLAAQIVMECAIPMAHIDPETVAEFHAAM